MMTREYQKGISIYLVVIMMSVLLATVLGLTSIIIGGAKIAGGLSDSVKAFHAADTGIEKALYDIYKSTDCSGADASGNFGSSGYGYVVAITSSGSCPDAGTVIDSTGQFQSSKRKIEVSFNGAVGGGRPGEALTASAALPTKLTHIQIPPTVRILSVRSEQLVPQVPPSRLREDRHHGPAAELTAETRQAVPLQDL